MSTSSDVVTIARLREFRDKNSKAEYFLEIPIFQRGLVWSDSKKRELIRSIYKGYPIGALLVYKVPRSGETRTTIQVIDGLQRSTALLDYVSQPLLVAPVADELISKSVFTVLAGILSADGNAVTAELVKKVVGDWAEKTRTLGASNGFTAHRIIRDFESSLNVTFSPDVVQELYEFLNREIIDALSAKFQTINEYQVPVIYYTGQDSELPEIFERLNSGTPLTKYDKFGATWSSHKAITRNRAIREAVKNRYGVYIDKGWEVSNFDAAQELSENDLNLFEYLVGLGKVLADKFPALFPAVDASSDAPSTAFALCTVAHGLRLSEMAHLPQKLGSPSKVVNLAKFEDALLDACSLVSSQLEPILSLKLNTRNATDRFLPHSDLQVMSLVLRVLLEKYDEKDWAQRSGKTQLGELLKGLLAHYTSDILEENWRGSGDSTLFERVWESNSSKILVRSSVYLQKPLEAEMSAFLDAYHSADLKKKQSDRSNISMKAKLLLRLIYSDIITHRDNATVQFDIEHLHPVKALADFIEHSKSEGMPISCLGNLAILSQSDNVIKGKTYVGDYLAKGSSSINVEKIKAYVVVPEASTLTHDTLVSADAYEEFCKVRFVAQKAIILKSLGY
jgi:Protein of unknown function DUF262